MKAILSILISALLLINTKSIAQFGYVKLGKDSILKGYIKPFRTAADSKDGLEVWKTKSDKKPIKILKVNIQEYAIGKDTVKVLHDFEPFSGEDLYFQNADATYTSRGKINLLTIKDYRNFALIARQMPLPVGLYIVFKRVGKFPFIYVLETKSGLIKAMPSENAELHQALLDFFPESFLQRYEKEKKEIKYKNLPELIEFYNSK